MPLIVTQAIVLHAFDYLETSRVLRLITRDAGVVSVIAKGARRTRGRVGSGVDLFAEGEAQIYLKPTRELHTLGSFDVTASRTGLAMEMSRFTAASALAELTLRIAGDETNPAMFDGVSSTLDELATAAGSAAVERALAGAWRIIGEAGFTPALDDCAACHLPLPVDATVAFSHPAGGALCDACDRRTAIARRLPPIARAVLREWQAGGTVPVLSQSEGRAHQRLLREFIREHVTSDDRPLRAFAAWETGFGSNPAGAA
ncbi:MAG TPA: DNA repair protein RecO [Gemmatimonadaceae bacterium]|jgi:DNA repair protein RecO (recombination protein O)